MPRAATVPVGRLGAVSFTAGHYAYAGSALNGLEGRIRRHLRVEKRRHWHIDYLLEQASVTAVVTARTREKVCRIARTGKSLECEVARSLGERYEVVPRFGASDCRCPGHLFRGDAGMKETVKATMRRLGLEPASVRPGQEG